MDESTRNQKFRSHWLPIQGSTMKHNPQIHIRPERLVKAIDNLIRDYFQIKFFYP